ncbi:MAG: hypothetical protein HY336_02895, partial [Candidatus Doudnabacteria bacterium]|nr:hypothetical protein [Candidatus Doudnabacteria bacterium]MBI3952877.1 hypothetical protein [Candidatus Doudnabacteria bacterium]
FDTTFQSVSADQFEVCSNSATINYTDSATRTKGLSFGPILCKTGRGTAPDFREVAP